MERFFVRPDQIGATEARITGEELAHLTRVLRMRPGQRVEIFDGLGKGYSGEIKEIDEKRAIVAALTPVTEPRDSLLRTCLVQGIPKGEKMEWVAQKATELGVGAILPLALERCVTRLEDEAKRSRRRERWEKVAREAARQCGRLTAPQVLPIAVLSAFLAQVGREDLLLIPWEGGGESPRQLFRRMEKPPAGWVYLLIGPEGGLTKGEVEQGVAAAGLPLTLGPRILRTETAGLALLAVLQYQWGDGGAAPSSHFV
ncbi:MAG: 16S rRNA (uracil(1498)-N(3))-methyltransferase [Peptococcaceae bacterium]|jgi:16S rRNA (uracil1498-N3)-methyltransferase|nr:16S rRNA (uracil(1498)-N(3))-methyltransferase [Peptococcaceae bacterium]